MPRPRKRRAQPVKGGLRGFTEAKKTKVDLLRDIQTHVVSSGVKNADSGRERHKVHVSEVVKGVCPRRLYYKLSGAEPSDPPAPAFHRMEMIWAAGHAEHEKWQRWLEEMGDLWGNWRCRGCDVLYENTFKPEQCGNCDLLDLFSYEEVNLEVPSMSLVGHADGAVPRLNALVEVKSFSVGTVRVENPKLVSQNTHKINGRSIVDHEAIWNAVKRPLKSHLFQGLFYLWMCNQMGLPFDKLIFIYENKTTQATKAFEVESTERLLRPFLESLTETVTAAQTGATPVRPVLYTKDARPCSECPFRTTCWGDNDDEGPEGTSVSAGGQGPRSEEAGGEAEVRPPYQARGSYSGGTGGHHRTRRQRSDGDDDDAHQVGRASRRAVGDGRGRREVGGSSDGEVSRPRFARRGGERRDPDEGESIRVRGVSGR